ncbi:MAG TPA: MASE1 domain-containing protein [Pyrinomonadaceae bacterium]|nr:MASE1 domain-containing protein [Pyrinomonadaceae bacterium]
MAQSESSTVGLTQAPISGSIDPNQSFRYLRISIEVFVVAAVYFAAAKIGLSFAYINASVSPVWPPTGVAIAAVLLLGYRSWLGIFLGAFLVNLLTPLPIGAATAIAAGNTTESVATLFLLRTLGFHKQFDRARDVFKFVIAVVLCTTISSAIGNLSLWLTGLERGDDFRLLWRTWWLGDLAGALIITPLLLTWLGKSRKWWSWSRFLEAALLMLLLSVTAVVTFGSSTPLSIRYYVLTCFIVPFLLWAAFRLGDRGVTLAIAALSAFAVWGTLRGLGPFIGGTANESLIVLQLFVASNAVSFLFLVAVVEERRVSEESRLENERRVAVNLAITQILAESPALTAATPRILQTIGTRLHWDAGAMWSLDPGATALNCQSFWSARSNSVKEFEAATRERTFSAGIGLPGRVWQLLKPCWIPDLVKDDNFPRAPIAVREDLCAAFAFPIVGGEKFVGVMEFFSHEIRQPDDDLLAMFGSIGSQIGQFMERRRAEDALRTREAELEVITDTTPLMLIRCSKDLRFVYVNRAYATLLGLELHEIIGFPIVEIIGADAFEVIRPYVEQVLQGQPVEYEQEVLFKTIGPRHLRAAYRPEWASDGAVVGWVASISDVSDRKFTEDALRQFAAIVESTDDAIIGMDLSGIVTGWNNAATELYGYSADEVIGNNVSILIPPEQFQEEEQILKKIRKGERLIHYETVRMAKNGDRINVSLTVSPIENDAGEVIGGSKIARDITERRRVEAEREELLRREHEARAEAEVANRVKDEFLATLSHELRTPLNAIVGWAGMLRTKKLNPEETERAIEIINRNAKAQTQLIESVLDVSRIVSGKLQFDLRPVDMTKVVEAAVDSMRPSADAKNIGVRMHVSANVAPVSGDFNRLQQVVWNLLTNAVKFSPTGTEIDVQLSPVAEDVQIEVRDRGQGISPDFLPHVFERFRQADASTTRRFGGLGLGLAIVRHLVEMHGGSIAVESEGEGKGATFTVRLPMMNVGLEVPQETGALQESIAAKLLLSGLKILLIEDEADTRELLVEMLSACDAEVLAAESATVGFGLLRERRPDIVVSDISMPDVDGYEFIRQVRNGSSQSTVPAIALTAHARTEDRRLALEAGFQEHLAKPVSLTDLARSIAKLVGRLNGQS